MQNHRTPSMRLAALLTLVVLAGGALTACGDADPLPSEPALAGPGPGMVLGDRSTNPSEMQKALATLRRATARYHRVEAAMADGFVQILPCIENPAGPGALGIPYARLDRFDATIDLSEPEILFYEPQPDGRLRLLGGEPVIPIELWTGSEPPSLFGLTFHRNEEHGLYGLHMWVWRHNPDGTFAFWHPDVSCEFAN